LNIHSQEKFSIKLPAKREQLQGKIDFCEGRINQLVYALYGLTAEEIAMVEGNVGK